MTQIKIYPLAGKPNSLHVCWSALQEKGDQAITHIVKRPAVGIEDKTLCGKTCGPDWAFAIWNTDDDPSWGVAEIGCARCKRSSYLETLPDNGKVDPSS